MALAGEPGDEDTNDLVANKLVDDRIVLNQHVHCGVVETVHELANGGRTNALSKRRGATHVRE